MNEDARRTRNCGIAKGASTARLARFSFDFVQGRLSPAQERLLGMTITFRS